MESSIRHAFFIFILLACRLKHAASAACGETSGWGASANKNDHAACPYRNAGSLCGGQFESRGQNVDGCKANWLEEAGYGSEPITGFPKMVTKGQTYRTNGHQDYQKWDPSLPVGDGADNPEDDVVWETYGGDPTKWTIKTNGGWTTENKIKLATSAARWCAQNSDVTDDRHACPACGTHSSFNGKGERECRMYIIHDDANIQYVQFFTENYCDNVEIQTYWYQKDYIYVAQCATRDPKGDECGTEYWESDCKRDIPGSESSFNDDRTCMQMYYDASAWGGDQYETDGFCQGPLNTILCSSGWLQL